MFTFELELNFRVHWKLLMAGAHSFRMSTLVSPRILLTWSLSRSTGVLSAVVN